MLLLLLLALQDDSIKFDKSYSAGLKAAKEKGQLVLLYFHQAGWEYCTKTDREVFPKSDVIDFVSKNLYAIKLDGKKDRDIFKKYKIQSTPTTIIADSDGDVVGTMPGYLPAGEWLKWATEQHASASKIAKWKAEAKDRPEDCALYKMIGDEYLNEKMDGKAADAYAKALELNEKREAKEETKKFKGEVLFNKGLAHYRKGDDKEKLKDIYKALLDLDLVDLKDNALLIRALYGLSGGENVDVMGTLEDAIAKYPKSDCIDGLLFAKGVATWKDGDKDGAVKILQDLQDKYPVSFFKDLAQSTIEQITGKKKPSKKK